MKQSTLWNIEDFERQKTLIKNEMESVKEQLKPDQIKHYLGGKIGDLAASKEPVEYMRRFIYAMHALIFHSKYGSFTVAEINSLFELIEAILKVNNIQPVRSKLSRIYSEYLFVKGQLALGTGDVWAATWLQQLAMHVADGPFLGGESFQIVSLGIRALRLGHTACALHYLEKAEDSQLSPRDFGRARAGRILALRISGQRQKASALIQETKNAASDAISSHVIDELQWESACLDIADTGDLAVISDFCKPSMPHHTPSYLLEFYLWAHCVQSTKFKDHLVKIDTLRRKRELNFKNYSDLLRFCRGLEDVYQNEINFARKLEKMERMVATITNFKYVSWKLLGWLAVTRWLSRYNSYSLASFALTEYRSLSLKLSEGGTPDVLGIAGDLLDKNWVIALPLSRS